MMTYKEYLGFVDRTFNSFNWRYGQTIMNVLHAVWPSKYNELVGTEHDCYYEESKTNNTLDLLSKEWPQNNATV
jgi:hypothetical protein